MFRVKIYTIYKINATKYTKERKRELPSGILFTIVGNFNVGALYRVSQT